MKCTAHLPYLATVLLSLDAIVFCRLYVGSLGLLHSNHRRSGQYASEKPGVKLLIVGI